MKTIVYPAETDQQIPEDATCQETWGMTSNGDYLRCGRKAVAIVKSPHPMEPAEGMAYYMCLPHADHNVRNRRCRLVFTTESALKER